MPNKVSIPAENFMKVIFMNEQDKSHDTRPGSIARALGISNAAATDMARNLAGKKLVRYEKYRKLELTPEGKKLALKLVRKHRLWETFLYRTLHMSLHEIHQEAELLEHQTSEFLAEKISSYLGDPEVDPHGDPIPGSDGELDVQTGHIPLSLTEPGKDYVITRLVGPDKEFFDFCNRNDIRIGSDLKVEKQYEDYPMTEIIINRIRLLLNADFSALIYVEPMPKE
jgi:DtxR family Mn-dependent transcriptional regulator